MPERTSARASARSRVERLRSHFASADRVLIMMQDDPDPDAIASALALRTLLGRTKAAAPIATFGTIQRPEHRAMTDRKSTRLNSSHRCISYAVFCLKKKKK